MKALQKIRAQAAEFQAQAVAEAREMVIVGDECALGDCKVQRLSPHWSDTLLLAGSQPEAK